MKEIETVFQELKDIKGKSVGDYLITKVYRSDTVISIDTQLGDKKEYIFYYISIEKGMYSIQVYKDFSIHDYYSMDIEGVIESMRIAEQYTGDNGIKPIVSLRNPYPLDTCVKIKRFK